MGTINTRDNIHINSKNQNSEARKLVLEEELRSIMHYEANDDALYEEDEETKRREEEEFKKHRERMNRRLEEMRAEREHQDKVRKMILRGSAGAAGLVLVGVILFFTIPLIHNAVRDRDVSAQALYESSTVGEAAAASAVTAKEPASSAVAATEASIEEEKPVYEAVETPDTMTFGSDIVSTNGILINADTMEVLAQRDAYTRVYPASMTKVLTLLVAVEHLTEEQLEDTFEITIDITDYSYSNDCSAVGFSVGEKVKVRDLLYGLILPSGGDAAVALADYVAGSQDDFVELMNDKLAEMGMADTAHFTNCVGLFNEDHYCTAYDMAMIMRAAIDNDLCREVLSTHHYYTSSTTEHPDGIEMSNWFLRRIEDRELGGTVVCGKTGFVVQSGSCAVSFTEGDNGTRYIVCTCNSTSSWQCIDDQTELYSLATGLKEPDESVSLSASAGEDSGSYSNIGGSDED